MIRNDKTLVDLMASLAEFWARVDRIVDAPAVDCFTANGEMQLGQLQCHGHVELAAFFADKNRRETAVGRFTRHVLTNQWLVSATVGAARLRSLILVYSGVGALPLPSMAPSTIADFVYDFEAAGDGWRMTRMVSSPIFIGAGAPATSVDART